MAWSDVETRLSDNQLLDGVNQAWSTNVLGSNSLRDLGRGRPLWANLHVLQASPADNTGLFRVSLRLITTPTTPSLVTAFAYTQLGLPLCKMINTLFVGSRLCFPIAPVVPNVDAGTLLPTTNDWNHPALGKKYIAALYERTNPVAESTPTGAFSNLRVSLELSLQPTAGYTPADQQYYPSGFRA